MPMRGVSKRAKVNKPVARKSAADKPKRKAARKGKRWSQAVTEGSDAMDLEGGVFKSADPKRISDSVLRSAKKSTRRRSPPLRSAISMLTFYINRAGSQLSKTRRQVLERAKRLLRERLQREKET